MRRFILLPLCILFLNFSYSKSTSSKLLVNFCFESGISIKKEISPYVNFSNDCNTPTAIVTSGAAQGPFNNTGVTVAGGNFNFPPIAVPNVQYFSINAAFFPPGTNRITVSITPGSIVSPQVWIMTACDGISGTLPAINITGICQAITPANYIIAVVSEAANAGTFDITVTASTGPSSTVTVTDVSGNANDDGEVCLDDDFTIQVDNTAGLTYSWDRNGTPIPNPVPAHTLSVTNAVLADGGTYNVTITDGNMCSTVVAQTIVVHNLPVVTLTVAETSGNANNDGEVCLGDDFTLNATAGGASYVWTLNGGPIAGATTETLIRTNTTAADDGVYEVTFEDANGCFNTDNITIDINPLPSVNNTTLEVCPNAGGQGDFTLPDAEDPPGFPATNSNSVADVDDGAAGVTVSYHTTLLNAQNDAGPIGPAYTAANGTIVFARVESNATGCFEIAQVTLTVNPRPTGVEIQNVNNGNSPANFSVCEGSPINLTTAVATGQAPFSYSYELPNSSTSTGQNLNVVASNPAIHDGIWSVTVTDANGCTATDVITITVTPNPVNDQCSGAIAINVGNNNGLTNNCATSTADPSPCSPLLNQASVWYEYVVAADVKTLTFTVSSANHVIEVYQNNCTTSLAGECDQSVTIDCPDPQTLKIYVSSATVNTGAFNINVTSVNTTAINDDCSSAQNVPNAPTCQFIQAATTTTIGACPENFSVPACALNYTVDEIVWYTFTTPAGTTSIDFMDITPGAFLTVFNDGCPASPTVVPGGSCISGSTSTSINVSANTTYKIGIGINGAPGQVTFKIRYNVPPANDVCAGAITINTGANNGLTNQCSTSAIDPSPCAPALNEASVWYEYVVPAGVKTLTFTVSSANHVLQVYQNNCSTLIAGECDQSVTIDCPDPQTLKIFISSATNNTGNFNVNVTSVNSTAVNDDCSDAQTVPNTPTCEFIQAATTTTIGACPENFNVTGCALNYTVDEIVWYTFTTPAGTTSIDFMDITPGAFLTVFGSGCLPVPTAIAGGSCISGSTSTSITVTPNTTYTIGIGINGAPGPVTFKIRYNVPPANDNCAGAIVVNTGNNNGLTNECATAVNDPTPCTGNLNQASVWYSYDVVPGIKTLTFTLSSANHVIEIYANNCTTSLAGECDQAVTLDCPDPQTLKVFVSSANANTGNFNLTIASTPTTAANDLCANAEVVPDNPVCQFIQASTTTTVGACPENFNVTGCALDYSMEEIVWYTFTTPAGTTSIEFMDITPNAFLTVFTGCAAVPTIVGGGSCISGATATPINVTQNTTYTIGIGINGLPGNVTFKIKYNVTLLNDDPCLAGFTATNLTGPLVNQSNFCATDDRTCGGNTIDKSVWYTYELTAPNDVINISVVGLTNPTIGIFEPGNPCTTPLVGEECAGDGSFEVRCLAPGIYNIMVGTSNANAGNFTITPTQSQNPSGPVNDLCTNATDLPILPTEICIIKEFNGTNINACPENIPGAGAPCDFNVEETVWFEFTAPGTAGQMPTMDFEFTNYTGTGTPFMALFSGGCGGLTAIDPCNSGNTTVFGNMGPLTAGNTYLIAVGSTADLGGNFTFEVKFNVGPANDDPCADLTNFDISGSGSKIGTTDCAGGDPIIPNCPSGDQENIVFYKFTVPVGSQGINVIIRANGTPGISGGVVAGVVTTACGSPTLVESNCSTGSIDYAFDCLEPGDYFLQVSTSSAGAGGFEIIYTPIADDGPINDICADAEDLTLPVCEWQTVSSTTLKACDEIFNLGGCLHGDNPTVWYEFTTPAGATQVDFRNISANTYLSFITTDCTANPLSGFCSVDTNPFENLPVMGNTTYRIAVGTNGAPAGEPFSFEIKVIVPPVNDCIPELVPVNGSATNTSTCCATYQNDRSNCPADNQESSVWYEYRPDPATKAVDIQFTPGSISGNIAVDVLVGPQGEQCTGTFDFAPNVESFCIAAAPETFTVKCIDFSTQSIYVKVGSKENSNNCGTFSLSFMDKPNCPAADLCADAANFPMIMPVTDGACSAVTVCNTTACSESGDCDPNGASTYIMIQTDPQATVVVVTITSPFTPIVSAFSGGCGGANPVNCEQVTTFDIAPVNNIIIVKVEAQNGVNLGNFTVEACALGATFDCHDIGMEVTRPDYPLAPQTGPFCPGETVNFCFDIDFIISPAGSTPPNGNNCQWIQGMIPTLGTGWDVVESNLPGQPPSAGGAFWLPEGNVDYNGNNNVCHIVTLPDGSLGLQVGGGTPLAAGTLLPGGWWITSNGGGAACTNDGDPDTMWGLPGGCGGSQSVDFCINLKLKDYDELPDCEAANANLNLFVFADGETGCWQNMSCALALPANFVGDVDCSGNITLDGDDKEICTGQNVTIEVVASESGAVITLETIDNPNVTGETLTGTFNNSIAQFTDNLVNTGTAVEIVQYVFKGRKTSSVCEGPPITIEVTVYPELLIEFPEAYVCEGSCTDLTPVITGGSGTYVSYQWSTGASTPSIEVCNTAPTTFYVTVTDSEGCMGTGEVEVDVKPPVQAEFEPDPIIICKDGVTDELDFVVANITSGTDPYTFTWIPPGNVFGVPAGTNYPDDTYSFDEENSGSNTLPLDMCVKIVDFYNCEVTICAELTIDGAPDVTFNHDPLACGANSTILRAVFDFGLSNSGLDKFELYDCNDNFLASKNSTPASFTISDLSSNNCFVLKTITDNGCITTKSLVVNPPQGVQAVLNVSDADICIGQSSTLSIGNSASYASFEWSNQATTSSITVSPLTSTIYFVTVTEPNGCTDIANVEIVVNTKPVIDLQGSTSFCVGSSTTLAIVDQPNTTYQWINLTDNSVTNSNQIVITVAGQYKAVATSAAGCVKDSTINVISSTSLTVQLNDLALCDGGVDTLSPGAFYSSYIWSKDDVIIPGQTSAKLPVIAAGNYKVTVTDASGCSGVGVKAVTNSPSPMVTVNSPVEVCRVNSGVGPTFINFNSLVTGAPGSWTDLEGSGVDLTTDISNVSFIGINRDTFTFRFITSNAILPCYNDTAFVDVIVNNCPCPTIAFDPILICNDEDQVNLNEYLKVSDLIREGVWSITNGPGTATISNDSLLNSKDINGGIYQLAWASNSVLGSCITNGTHSMDVNEAPIVGNTGDVFICNASSGLGSTSIDLNTILTGGSAGTWLALDGGPLTGSIVNGLGQSPKLYEYEFTSNNAIAPCENVTTKVKVDIKDCNCPFAQIEIDTLCNGSDQVNLNSLITLFPPNTPGTWSSSAAGAVSGSTFDAQGVTSGAYKITFTLAVNPGGTCATSFDQDIIISRQPVAEKLIDGQACNVGGGSNPTSIGLFNLLKNGYTQGGIWTQISGPNTLAIPGNAFVDFTGLNIGDEYEFRYDVDAKIPCVPASAVVKVSVKDCNCPNTELLPTTDICNTALSYDLKPLQGPDLAPGNWTVAGPLNEVITVKPDNTFDVNGLSPGNYRMTYTLDPAPTGSCDKSNSVTLKIVEQLDAVLKTSQTVCTENKGNNENVIDFSTLVTSGYFGGTWQNTDNAPVSLSNPRNVSFSNAKIGDIYTFTYVINNTDPCVDRSYTIEIEVIDCLCPIVSPYEPEAVCTNAGTLDLSIYNDPVNAGKWTSTEFTITNNIANIANLTSKNYKIFYVLDNPLEGCPDRVELILPVVKEKNAGQVTLKDLCSNEPETINLASLLTGEDTGGTWTEISSKPSSGSAFNKTAGTFNTNGQAAGTYLFEYAFKNQSPCPDAKQTVTVNIISAPTAQAGDPGMLTCTVNELTLGDPTDNQTNVTYEWTHDSGNPVQGGDKATIKVNYGGKFTIKVVNTVSGCETVDDVVVSVDPNRPNAQIDSKNVSCFNAKDGSIAFVNVTGGAAPLQYSKDGGATFQNTPTFAGLSGGKYTMVIKDAIGCVLRSETEITEPVLLSINVGDDVTINLGDSVLSSILNQIPAGAKDIKWTNTDIDGVSMVCTQPTDDCLEVALVPKVSSTLCAMVIDNNDCEAQDCRNIALLKARNIVFSNVITEGGSQDNPTFYVESSSVAWVNKMRIYDRWGNLMFERVNVPANQPEYGWNGKFNGKNVTPGVYTWLAEIEYDKQGSGDIEVFTGDVTVIK